MTATRQVRQWGWAGPQSPGVIRNSHGRARCRCSVPAPAQQWRMSTSHGEQPGGSLRPDRSLFNDVAAAYDRGRPGYPDALIGDLVRSSGLSPESRILEIGCGTGQLTRLLATTGARIDCVELGADLVRLAQANLARYPNVVVHHAAFESWETSTRAYDLIMSAQAFHWIPPEIGYRKCLQLMKPEGSLALVWNLYRPSQDPVHDELQQIYARLAPELHKSPAEEPCGRAQGPDREDD